LKCLLTAVAPMLPPDLVIKALISSLVTSPEALDAVGSDLMAGEGFGSFLIAASFLMAGAAVSSDLIEGSCACKTFHSPVMNRLEGAIVMYIDICSHSQYILFVFDFCVSYRQHLQHVM
jgi:hypothetical protein